MTKLSSPLALLAIPEYCYSSRQNGSPTYSRHQSFGHSTGLLAELADNEEASLENWLYIEDLLYIAKLGDSTQPWQWENALECQRLGIAESKHALIGWG